jgi:hypothetical protein
MRTTILCFFMALVIVNTFSQTQPNGLPPGLPPGYLDQIKKMLPPGTKLPSELTSPGQTEETVTLKPLIELPPEQEPQITPAPEYQTGNFPYNSGRNEAQRKAALFAVNDELQKKPFMLPTPESRPSQEYMLKMALERSKAARQKFNPAELSDYTKIVTWIPKFDGKNSYLLDAKKYSLIVSLATNFAPKPHFIIALAAAVFEIDPASVSGANNFASAIITAGELLQKTPAENKSMAIYQKDAESAYLYAIYASVREGNWTADSFTPAINMGNLCIDLGKYEEARSLFMVARLLKPASWDAALGLAAYFHAIKQPDKALAILEDDNLDRPMEQLLAVKSAKELKKTEKYAQLPLGSPEEVYKEGIDMIASEPILTSADFLAQFDQSERNKMRYFIEHLPETGSFSAPTISKLTQYSTVKAISGPQGISALSDFSERYGRFEFSSVTNTVKQQMEWLSKMGLKIDSGVNLDDVVKHPEKYGDRQLGKGKNIKVSGMSEFMKNIQEMKKQAESGQRDLAAGKTASTMALASRIDPYFTILGIDPEEYADPMNVMMQKHNFSVYNRKTNLYNGYLYSVCKKTKEQIDEITKQAQRKYAEMNERSAPEYKAFADQMHAEGIKDISMAPVEWKLRLHKIHMKYLPESNNIVETCYGSATNVASTAYVNRIKPMAEAYYYDVIRHVALISDTDVRDQKEALLRTTINSYLSKGLYTVLIAFSSGSYSDDWDCDCDIEALLKEREAEQAAKDEEENARIARNKNAKMIFDKKDIPESTQLWKKLDSYADITNYGFFKVRSSCARTTIILDTDKFPVYVPDFPRIFGTATTNEFTGETKVNGSTGFSAEKKFNGGSAKVNLDIKGGFTMDANNVIRDWFVTPSGKAELKVGNTTATVDGQVTIGPQGVKDYSVTGDINTSVKYGETTVKGGAKITISNGKVDTDFSAGIDQDFKTEVGGEANVAFEASTKRGCSLSGKVEQNFKTTQEFVDNSGLTQRAEDAGIPLPKLDSYKKKTLWSGKFEQKK